MPNHVSAATVRMPRPQRREHLLEAAIRAFCRTGFSDTSVDAIASEAGISRVILYRHFESKTEIYRAALELTCVRLGQSFAGDHDTANPISTLIHAATKDPDGFRLLYRFSPKEPDFQDLTSQLAADAVAEAHRHLAQRISDPQWTEWAAQLAPKVTTEAILAWLDAGCPDPDHVAARINAVLHSIIRAAANPTALT